MAQQVVTELVIDSDTSGADKFSQSMDKASSSAQSGVSSAAQVSLAIAGVGVAALGALAGLRAFVDYVGNQTQALVDMDNQAKLAGVSLKEFQETLFAARSSGISEKDFISGIDRIGADLTAASRGVTEFGKLFEANGLSIKNANGELKTTNQAVADLAGLVQNASPQIQQAIAKIAGVSASWVPFLKQGVEGIEAQKKAAADLGIIIDDDMIAKATEFNAQWKTAVAIWDTQFKASLASILPLLIQLANIASSIIDTIGSISGSVSRWLTPDDSKSQSQLQNQIADVMRLKDLMEGLTQSSGEIAKLRVINLQGMLGLPEGATLQQVDALLNKLIALADKPSASRVEVTGGTTVLPPTGGSDARTALEVEIDRLEKHIAVTNADTEAVGLSAAAQAGLRAEATLYQAALRDGETDLEKYADAFFKMRQRVEEATDKLDKARQKLSDIGQFTGALATFSDTLIQGMIKGTDATQNLVGALGSLGSSLQSIGTKSLGDSLKSLLSGGAGTLDPTALGLGALGVGVSIVSSIIGGNSKAAQELAQAKKAWDDMASQVQSFNAAAKGFNLGPITQAIQSLFQQQMTLATAAYNAQDFAGLASIQATFNAGAVRLVSTFQLGTQTLTPLQQAMKDLTDEASGLQDELNSLNLTGLASTIPAALQSRMTALISQFQQSFVDGLVSDLNTNAGKGYLNDISAAFTALQNNLKDAALLGGGVYTLLAQGDFSSKAQSIVDGAKLTGSAFDELIQQFPQLASVVHAFVDQAAIDAKALADSQQQLTLQMRLLTATTDASTQSGALLLFDAKAKQERDAALAGGISPGNLLLLDQSLAAERLNVIKGFTDQAVAAEKQLADTRLAQMQRIQQYLDNLTGGSSSTLSPQDRLAAAQSQFTTQLGLAKGGDANAIANITSYSDNLLKAARDYYASSQGYQDIFASVFASLQGLTGSSLAGSAAAGSAGLPGSSSSVSIPGVSGVSTSPVAANTNNDMASLIAAVNGVRSDLNAAKAEIVLLKGAVNTGNQIAVQASTDENAHLANIDTNLSDIRSSNSNTAFASAR